MFVRFSTAAGNKGSAEPAARDFVADAFAYMKFIGHTPAAVALFGKAGLPENRGHGFITINGESDCSAFVTACRKVRYWNPHRLAPERIITIINAGLNPAREK